MGKGKQRRRERKKPTNVPINDFLRCRSPFPIHPPSFAEDLSGPQNSSFITFALSPFSSEGTKRNDRKRERVFLAFYMESCQFSVFLSILFALAMATTILTISHAMH